MNDVTHFWWSLLCGVSALNVLAWVASTHLLRRRCGTMRIPIWSDIHWHVVLSAAYVFGCAYRSVFPVYDVQRLVMVDCWLSSVVVGRSVATLAELCFAAQWALLLKTIAQTYSNPLAARVSRWIVPMIVVAEICSWYAVLTTSNLGHVMEEALWGLSAAMLVTSFLFLWPRSDRSHRPFLALASVIGFCYVVYMFAVDVPMYWARWVIDEGRGHEYLSIAQGLADVSGRWVLSHRWTDWESEVVWMSLYFSVAVWFSIGLMHASKTLKTRQIAFGSDQDSWRSIRTPVWFTKHLLP